MANALARCATGRAGRKVLHQQERGEEVARFARPSRGCRSAYSAIETDSPLPAAIEELLGQLLDRVAVRVSIDDWVVVKLVAGHGTIRASANTAFSRSRARIYRLLAAAGVMPNSSAASWLVNSS